MSVSLRSEDRERLDAIVAAVSDYAREFGFEVCERLELERGSLLQRLRLRMRDPTTRAEVKRRVELAEHTLIQRQLGQVQAGINLKQAKAAAELYRMIEDADDLVISLGSLIAWAGTRPDGTVTRGVVELTPDEQIALNRDRRAMCNPAAILELLGQRRLPPGSRT